PGPSGREPVAGDRVSGAGEHQGAEDQLLGAGAGDLVLEVRRLDGQLPGPGRLVEEGDVGVLLADVVDDLAEALVAGEEVERHDPDRLPATGGLRWPAQIERGD